jgi:dGTPase
MIRLLYAHYCDKPQDMGAEGKSRVEIYGLEQAVTDYVAGMTDNYAVNAFREIYIPKGWDKY